MVSWIISLFVNGLVGRLLIKFVFVCLVSWFVGGFDSKLVGWFVCWLVCRNPPTEIKTCLVIEFGQ